MSAALEFPAFARAAAVQRRSLPARMTGTGPSLAVPDTYPPTATDLPAPVTSLAFYRKHTEILLRRYLYASVLVCRAPSVLTEPLNRGFSSSRRIETFEDCVIFVLDMEKCLARLPAFDCEIINRIVLQEYSHSEAALLVNRSERMVCARLARALDQLTEILLDTGILRIPH